VFEDRRDVAEADEDGGGRDDCDGITTYEDNKHCREAQGAVTNNSVICFNL